MEQQPKLTSLTKYFSLTLATVAYLSPQLAQAATHTWDGGGANDFVSNSANWTSNSPPPLNGVPGSALTILVFPGNFSISPILDAPMTLGDIQFTNSAATFFASATSEITLQGDVINSGSGSSSLAIDLKLNSTASLQATGGDLDYSGNLNLNKRDLSLVANTNRTLSMVGEVSGSYLPQFGGIGMTKTGAGTLDWGGNNTYTVPLAVDAGTLRVVSNTALPAGSPGLTLASGTQLVVNNGVSLTDHPVALAGRLEFVGTSTWEFDTGLSFTGSQIEIFSSGNLGTLTEPVNGDNLLATGQDIVLWAQAGDTLRLEKGFDLTPNGTTPNVTIGSLTNGSGTVQLTESIQQTFQTPGNLGEVTVISGTLELSDNEDLLGEFPQVTLDGGANLSIVGEDQTVQNLSGSGDVTASGATLTAELTADYTTFEGDISGRFATIGTGRLTIPGTIDGGCSIAGHSHLRLDDGRILNDIFENTTIESNATLSGTGDVGNLRVEGTLSLGENYIGTLTATSLTLSDDGIIEWNPGGWLGSAGTGWPQLSSTRIDCEASEEDPTVIRINTDAIVDFDGAAREFLFLAGFSIFGFEADKFVIEDSSNNPFPGTWSLEAQDSVGLALQFTPDAFGYEGWISGYGYSGNDALPTSDPDDDGLANLLEYALHADPTTDDGVEQPNAQFTESAGGTLVSFNYPRSTEADVYYHISAHYSTDLESWFPLATLPDYSETAFSLAGQEGIQQVQESIPFEPTAYPAFFLRLSVEEDES